jgi:hypothetical protein
MTTRGHHGLLLAGAGGGGGGTGLLLDQMTSPVVYAYSLRKLREAYSGAAVNVRRSSDNTTQDIGFDANGDFDSASLLSFCGAGDGYIAKWYEQSGNGLELQNTTNSQQLKICASGALVTKGANSRASALFSGAQRLFTASTPSNLPTGNQPRLSNVVASASNNAQAYIGWTNTTDTGQRSWCMATTGGGPGYQSVDFFTGGLGTTYPASTDLGIITAFLRGTADGAVCFNGAKHDETPPSLNTTAAPIYMGYFVGAGSWYLNGYMSEAIMLDDYADDSERGIIEADQADYYGITLA